MKTLLLLLISLLSSAVALAQGRISEIIEEKEWEGKLVNYHVPTELIIKHNVLRYTTTLQHIRGNRLKGSKKIESIHAFGSTGLEFFEKSGTRVIKHSHNMQGKEIYEIKTKGHMLTLSSYWRGNYFIEKTSDEKGRKDTYKYEQHRRIYVNPDGSGIYINLYFRLDKGYMIQRHDSGLIYRYFTFAYKDLDSLSQNIDKSLSYLRSFNLIYDSTNVYTSWKSDSSVRYLLSSNFNSTPGRMYPRIIQHFDKNKKLRIEIVDKYRLVYNDTGLSEVHFHYANGGLIYRVIYRPDGLPDHVIINKYGIPLYRRNFNYEFY